MELKHLAVVVVVVVMEVEVDEARSEHSEYHEGWRWLRGVEIIMVVVWWWWW